MLRIYKRFKELLDVPVALGGKILKWKNDLTGLENVDYITDHTQLTTIGTNTHAQIDTFLTNTTNQQTTIGEPMGVVTPSDISLSYNQTNRTLTISPTGSSFVVWRRGTKYTFSSTYNIQHADSLNAHYYCVDATGNIIVKTTSFDLSQDAPIAVIYYNTNCTPKGWLLDERHGVVMDWMTHTYNHCLIGAQLSLGGHLTSGTYALAASNSTTAHNTFGIDATPLAFDEDLVLSIPQFVQDTGINSNGYTVLYRYGAEANKEWRWTVGLSVPYLVGGNGFIIYNRNNGGTWDATTEAANGNYINYYLCANPNSMDDRFRWFLIPGQSLYTTLATAQAEKFYSLDINSLPSAEIVPRYQITFRVGSTYAQTGKCRIEAEPVFIGGPRFMLYKSF